MAMRDPEEYVESPYTSVLYPRFWRARGWWSSLVGLGLIDALVLAFSSRATQATQHGGGHLLFALLIGANLLCLVLYALLLQAGSVRLTQDEVIVKQNLFSGEKRFRRTDIGGIAIFIVTEVGDAEANAEMGLDMVLSLLGPHIHTTSTSRPQRYLFARQYVCFQTRSRRTLCTLSGVRWKVTQFDELARCMKVALSYN